MDTFLKRHAKMMSAREFSHYADLLGVTAAYFPYPSQLGYGIDEEVERLVEKRLSVAAKEEAKELLADKVPTTIESVCEEFDTLCERIEQAVLQSSYEDLQRNTGQLLFDFWSKTEQLLEDLKR